MAGGLDVIIGGSQKALMIPPGLAYCAVSERAWKRMDASSISRYYFDFRKERKAAAKGESSTLRRLLCLLHWVQRWTSSPDGQRRFGRRSKRTLWTTPNSQRNDSRESASAWGLTLFSPSAPAAALTAVNAPVGIDSGKLVKEFRESFVGSSR